MILPLVFELIEPRRIVDVGCGTGSWLAVARDLGVEEILGVDGNYVDPKQLEIPADRFVSHDLRQGLRLGESFDMAISLEVGEHLPESRASAFVDLLVSLAPVVLFSAAVPHQGGTAHVNEQWQDWWAGLFRQQGYVPVDCVRPRVWNDERVRYFYAQNTLLYVRESDMERYPRLRYEHDGAGMPLRVVHPRLFASIRNQFPPPEAVTAGRSLRFGARLINVPIRRRLARRRGK